ncbi:cytidylyltransferase domain-containing protein [Mucilaginibacter pedocola]|uniref:Acylneuraminate cytidylyltransferase n=1 Tax=Mucilaginibacter pedocola TaxID=1792845 RepID=A0A1S9PFT2_9SPHI|nr:glycosyltransferase family protein [Mucilaginibacter pedocola]OOQ59811.1 acylneuraminate cytidylyltransferase [Mucilaginibacter pedocola]
MGKNIVIVVQARMASSRLPGKVMLPILSKTLLARMIERLEMIYTPATVVIATSQHPNDNVIAREADMLDVPYYRGDLNNLLDRHYQLAKAYQADVVLKIPSDCPLIDPAVIDEVLGFFLDSPEKYDYVSNLHPATWPDGNDVEIITMDCLERTWKQATRPLELEHTTPYIWENPSQFKIGNVEWATGLDYSMSHRFTIDYHEDYLFIKRVFEELYEDKPDFSCEDILNLLERKPEIYELNAKYAGVNWYRNHLDELITVGEGQTNLLFKNEVE